MAYQHNIEKDRCKGCGLCIAVCPKMFWKSLPK
jgi:2-oxoglutarate ferredoxin oxidoreductase subunit delta